MAEATPPAQDWSSFTEDDASWLEGLDISSDLQGANEGDVDWLVPSDTGPTVSTGATTATLHNLDDLGGLFERTIEDSFDLSDGLQMELDQWEQEALTGASDDSEWTDVPTSLSSIAQREQEARELSAWDEKDRADQFLDDSPEPYNLAPSTPSAQSLPQSSTSYPESIDRHDLDQGYTPDLPQWDGAAESGTAENGTEDYGDWSPELSAPSYLDSPPNSQLDSYSANPETYEQDPVSQDHFRNPSAYGQEIAEVNFDSYGIDQSAFDMGLGSSVPADPSENYLDNFDLESAAIELNLDIDLEDFRSSATVSTPPLHETFTGSNLPPITSVPDAPTTGGDSKWGNKQMSTGLNPDRKPFESAHPSLITDTTGATSEMNSIDIFDMDQNTDWSGLLEQDTEIAKPNAPAVLPPPPAPDAYKKAPALQPSSPAKPPAPSLPPPLPNTPHPPVKKVTEKVLHQEVRQFQQMLDDSNLSAVVTKKGIQMVDEPVLPLHGMAYPSESAKSSAPKFNLPTNLPNMGQLPWAQIGKVAGIGLGVIGLLWGGAVILDRPMTQLGLRLGWWKNVSARDLSGMDLSGGNMRGADLSKANLRGANLEKADLSIANLAEADLTSAKLAKATIRGTNFQGAKIGKKGTKEETKLDREAFVVWQAVNERLDGLNLSRLNLLGVNLNNASLIKANLSNSTLSFATFKGANLTSANLRGAILESADFSDANLAGADFRDTNFGKNPPTSSEATTCPDRKKGPCKFERFR